MFTKIKINDYFIVFFILVIMFEIGFLKYDLFTRSKSAEEMSSPILSEKILDKDYEDLNILYEREKWTERIKSIGPAHAYSEFKKEFASFHYEQQHSVAHLFGELLFQAGGTTYLPNCDSSYGFGCYHGFFTTAIYSEGTSAVKELDRVCVDAGGPGATGCQHGLGHGLVEYHGHTLDGLKKALDSCELTTSFSKKFGCTSGVFMEFNIPTSLTGEAVVVESRTENEGGSLYPCDSVEEEFRESCYYELPQYWKNLYSSDTTVDAFTKIGTTCSAVEGQLYKESCYLGMGHVLAPSSDYDVNDIMEVCQTIATEEELLLCLAGAVWETYNWEASIGNGNQSQAFELCKSLPAASYQECINKSDLINHNGTSFNSM